MKQIKAQRQIRLAARERQLERLLTEATELASQQNDVDARLKYKEALKQTDDDAVKAKIKSLIEATRNR